MQQLANLIPLLEKLRTPKVLLLCGVALLGLIVFAYIVERPLYDQIMSFLPVFIGTIILLTVLCLAIAIPLEWAIKKIAGMTKDNEPK